ncbi:MAG: hypothetical protein C4K60_20205 [Ideonella sp. MAG2]|nr:MAG: hypothetical protein C4K60_20205 [Ideonella sp. MAG2]
MHNSLHASIRGQQRAIPPFVDFLLDSFGEELHDGRGGIRVFFSHKSVRQMERAFGHQPVALFKRYFGAYKVESTDNGCVITRGWRTGKMLRS